MGRWRALFKSLLETYLKEIIQAFLCRICWLFSLLIVPVVRYLRLINFFQSFPTLTPTPLQKLTLVQHSLSIECRNWAIFRSKKTNILTETKLKIHLLTKMKLILFFTDENLCFLLSKFV